MAFSPFARFRNFTLDNLKALLEVYPDMSRSFNWSEAGDLIEANSKGYKRTSYQQACQFGLEDRGSEYFKLQSYLFTFEDENLLKYLEFWMKTYYAPNPYVNSNDEPFIIYTELGKELLQAPDLTVDYMDFFSRRIGGKSEDILLNAIKAFCGPIKYRKDVNNNKHYFYIDTNNINALKEEIAFIEESFSINDALDKSAFFERYSYSNFCKFHGIVNELPAEAEQENDNTRVKRVTEGANFLLYGVPGSGKSHKIDEIIKNLDYERVVFHPDYTYSDFVGQIMPRLKPSKDGSDKLSYEFVHGPFIKALRAAEKNPNSMHYLVIEEINRGNAPAIFGDIFQLLDRNTDGSGKYAITNFDIAREVYGDEEHEVRIPSNLTILATMNTSDQNVFTLDTAFQRRWNMKYIENDIDNADHANEKIENSEVTWAQFANVVNETLLENNAELGNSEDKQLGAYFVTKEELAADKFPEKALKYLWDDAFKLNHDIIFRTGIKSIGDLIFEYHNPKNEEDPLKDILNDEIYNKMLKKVKTAPDQNEGEEAQEDDIKEKQ